MRRYPQYFLAFCLLSFAGAAAHADTVQNFSFTGDFAGPEAAHLGNATGTVTIDTTTGVVNAVNISFTDYSIFSTTITEETPFIVYGSETEIATAWHENNAAQTSFALEDLYLPVSSLVGYAGGAICSIANACAGGMSSADYLIKGNDFLDGQLTLIPQTSGSTGDASAFLNDAPVAATPEPTSLLLLGTGILGGAVLLARRRVPN